MAGTWTVLVGAITTPADLLADFYRAGTVQVIVALSLALHDP